VRLQTAAADHPVRRLLPVAAAGVLVTAMLMWLSPDFGPTWDERPRHAYGERVLQFLRGDRPRADFAPDGTGRHLYAGLFDVAAAVVHEKVGGGLWTTRHYLNALFGGLGVIATGLLAARLGGPAAGLLATLLLACSPRYVGHSMNNPKDMPFAALCAVALLSFTLVGAASPWLTWRRALLIGLAIALPLNVRPGAVLYLGYLGVLVAFVMWRAGAWGPRQLVSTGSRLAVVACVALVAGTAFWPWAQANPLIRPFEALLQASQFEWRGTVLFAGRDVLSFALPASYVPVWMAVTIPPVVLGGVAAALVLLIRRRAPAWHAGLWAVATIPLLLVVVRNSTLYDGWRHMLFVYPPLVVLAADAWRRLIVVERQWLRRLSIAALVVGCLEPAVFMIRNHPNEVVYFNGFVGGPRGALGRFELDYWGNSVPAAVGWTADIARVAGRPLCVAGTPADLVMLAVRRRHSLYTRRTTAQQHHLHVQLLRGSTASVRELLNRPDILHVVQMHDGTPLAVVVPGPRFGEVADKLVPHLCPGTAWSHMSPERASRLAPDGAPCR
jgi:hypothetical protein